MPSNHDQSVLTLPRAQWTEHPHYPSQVLLLGSHEQFRHISRVLLDRLKAGGDMPGIYWVFRQWKAAMGSHEAYEERKLYRYLASRWELSCDDMTAGHEALHRCDQAVRSAFGNDDREAAIDALSEHDEVLKAHLELEEDLVIPALLALSPEEFQEYRDGDIEQLLGKLREPPAA